MKDKVKVGEDIMVFCTLYDSNYLDKGLAMYYSLNRLTHEFKMYVLAMDEKCYQILCSLNEERLIPVSMDEFLDDDLKVIKEDRNKAEFCWTCTSHFIHFVLTNKKESICTYVDADLYFYNNPQVLIDEIGEKDIQIVEHRFSNSLEDKISLKHSGRFCVQFNTFKNSYEAIQLLEWWMAKCKDSCTIHGNNKTFGDQKYLEKWSEHKNVEILQHLGGGVAPWNVGQYELISKTDTDILLKKRKSGEVFNLIFYHYHQIEYLEERKANINVFGRYRTIDEKLVYDLYIPYLRELNHIKNKLKNDYGFYPMLKVHPALKNDKKKTLIDIVKNINIYKILNFLVEKYKNVRIRQRKYMDIIEI